MLLYQGLFDILYRGLRRGHRCRSPRDTKAIGGEGPLQVMPGAGVEGDSRGL